MSLPLRKLVAFGLEVGAQLAVVVDFSVEDYLDGAVFVAHGLIAGAQIDDAEAPVAQRGVFVGHPAVGIRTAMRQAVAHLLQHVP